VPEAAVSNRSKADNLFDHPVGTREHRWRNFEAERLGRLEIDDELKLGWLHDRQVGRLFALEDTAGIDTSLTMGAVRFIP
jgi:hypothetical protein